MRITAMMTMAVLAGASGWAGESRTAAEPKVTACITLEQHQVESKQAQGIATKMFADIGVQVEWRTNKKSCAANGVIVIKLTEHTPRGYRPAVRRKRQAPDIHVLVGKPGSLLAGGRVP